jgi:hypothetical protein
VRDLSLPFGTIEAKGEEEELVPHPYVPSTPSEELRRSRATPSSFRKKKPLQHASSKDHRVHRNVLS